MLNQKNEENKLPDFLIKFNMKPRCQCLRKNVISNSVITHFDFIAVFQNLYSYEEMRNSYYGSFNCLYDDNSNILIYFRGILTIIVLN